MKEYCGYYNNDDYRIEYNGAEYSVALSAYGEGWYEPGTMYRSNGDPGDPPDGDWEIKEIDISQIKVWDDDQDTWENLTDYSDEYDRLEKILKDEIESNLEESDFEIADYVPEHEEEDW
jgi:hypothetical protein